MSSKQIPREVYELLQALGITDYCAGQYVDGYGYILPELTVTPFESRQNEIFYDVEYGNYVVPEVSRPEAIPANGFGIIVLLNSSGANHLGHQAVLIGNERYGWTYISKDQYEGHNPFSGKSKYIIKEFRSFAKFKASAHNHSLKDEYDSHSTINNTEVDSLNYKVKRDSQGRPIERYDQAYFVPTDPIGNIAALVAAIQSAQKKYVLIFGGDCSDVPTKALRAAGKKDGEPAFGDGYDVEDAIDFGADDIDQAPKSKQKKIRKRNPDGKEIK
ncbi:MAG: hypothetical protein LBV74_09730 [Tannerella sp.]|jgi:hypothetical protein|nr:hypothetical protein [Tannerella sp.]